MSFGFSISDITQVIQLTTRTYRGWKNACGEYNRITRDLETLESILSRLAIEVRQPTSLLLHHDHDLGSLQKITFDCDEIVTELEELVTKYKSLGTNYRRNWDRLMLGNTDVNRLREKLQRQISLLDSYLNVLGISSQGRVEANIQDMKKTMDHLAAELRTGRYEGSVMTTYENDEKEVWRLFRRELISAGFRSDKTHRAKHQLRTYLRRMNDAGLLDEDAPEEIEDLLSAAIASTQASTPTSSPAPNPALAPAPVPASSLLVSPSSPSPSITPPVIAIASGPGPATLQSDTQDKESDELIKYLLDQRAKQNSRETDVKKVNKECQTGTKAHERIEDDLAAMEEADTKKATAAQAEVEPQDPSLGTLHKSMKKILDQTTKQGIREDATRQEEKELVGAKREVVAKVTAETEVKTELVAKVGAEVDTANANPGKASDESRRDQQSLSTVHLVPEVDHPGSKDDFTSSRSKAESYQEGTRVQASKVADGDQDGCSHEEESSNSLDESDEDGIDVSQESETASDSDAYEGDQSNKGLERARRPYSHWDTSSSETVNEPPTSTEETTTKDDLPEKDDARVQTVTYEALPSSTLAAFYRLDSKAQVPEGWYYMIDAQDRRVYIDLCSGEGGQLCFWEPPIPEENPHIPPPFGWERHETRCGRISWIHSSTGLVSNEYPTKNRFIVFRNGEPVHCFVKNFSQPQSISSLAADQLVLRDDGVARQISREV